MKFVKLVLALGMVAALCGCKPNRSSTDNTNSTEPTATRTDAPATVTDEVRSTPVTGAVDGNTTSAM